MRGALKCRTSTARVPQRLRQIDATGRRMSSEYEIGPGWQHLEFQLLQGLGHPLALDDDGLQAGQAVGHVGS